MKIEKAEVLGFCFGVRRAVDIVEDKLQHTEKIATLGPIVHNPNVVQDLSDKGAKVVSSLDEVDVDSVVITAHGAGQEIHNKAESKGLDLVDTTCPIVRKAQETAAELVKEGFDLVIYGEEDHPEIRNILGWIDGHGVAIMDPNQPIELTHGRVALLSQTTKGKKYFFDFATRFLNLHRDELEEVHLVNTTCPETRRRFEAVEDLAERVELVLVVGGKNSANTRKLAEVCANTGVPTHHIQDESEIDPAWIEGLERVGITAGASTPESAVGAVEETLKRMG